MALVGMAGAFSMSNTVSNSHSGAISYSMSTDGVLTSAPAINFYANPDVCGGSMTGFSTTDANNIAMDISVSDTTGDAAAQHFGASGPGASLTNGELFAYAKPGIAWAGMYFAQATGIGGVGLNGKGYNAAVNAENGLNGATSASNWYQDSMSGNLASGAKYAMTNFYPGGAVAGPNVQAFSGTNGALSTNVFMQGYASEHVNSQSMAYIDPNIGYSNIDMAVPGHNGLFSYDLKNPTETRQDIFY